MKTLILLRHGKSDWSGSVPDHQRPINHRGRMAATAMAEWLMGEALVPDRMLVSTATRTQETADRLVTVWGDVTRLSLDTLYLAEPCEMIDVIRGMLEPETLLVLGHNPGIEMLAARLSQGECPAVMPTCTAAVLRFGVTQWGDVAYGEGRLIHHKTPKSL